MGFLFRALLPGFIAFLAVSYAARSAWLQPSLAKYNIVDIKTSLALRTPDIDTVFVGTSIIETGINPDVFDAEMARRGHTLRSFNFGIRGLNLVEMAQVVERLLIEKPGIKYVLLMPAFQHLGVARSPDSIRAVSLFNIANAVQFSYMMLRYPYMPRPAELQPYLRNVASATLRHYSNIGLGAGALGLAQVEGEQQYAIWQVRGFKQFSGTLSGQAIEDFMGELPKIDQSRPVLIEQAKRIEDIATVHISSPMLEYVVSIAKYVERQGRSAFIVMPPGVWFWQMQMELSAKLRLRCGPARMLDFGDPARFETLYRRELFADNAHLNTEGAAVWSSLVAERFAEILDAEQRHSNRSGFCGGKVG